MVLSIGEIVTQVIDSGFLTSVETLAVQQIGDDSLIQVHLKGVRHIRNRLANEWMAPQHRSIVAAAMNERQVAVAPSSGEIVYFEMGSDGSLAEYDEKKEISGTITCLSLSRVLEGRQRSSFLAVGCDGCTVRILSLDPNATLESKSVCTSFNSGTLGTLHYGHGRLLFWWLYTILAYRPAFWGLHQNSVR
jgi:splicing factor 3B subunit 3